MDCLQIDTMKNLAVKTLNLLKREMVEDIRRQLLEKGRLVKKPRVLDFIDLDVLILLCQIVFDESDVVDDIDAFIIRFEKQVLDEGLN